MNFLPPLFHDLEEAYKRLFNILFIALLLLLLVSFLLFIQLKDAYETARYQSVFSLQQENKGTEMDLFNIQTQSSRNPRNNKQ